MIPPPCECGHSMYDHADKHGYFKDSCDGLLCRCTGYLGHSELILPPEETTPTGGTDGC